MSESAEKPWSVPPSDLTPERLADLWEAVEGGCRSEGADGQWWIELPVADVKALLLAVDPKGGSR